MIGVERATSGKKGNLHSFICLCWIIQQEEREPVHATLVGLHQRFYRCGVPSLASLDQCDGIHAVCLSIYLDARIRKNLHFKNKTINLVFILINHHDGSACLAHEVTLSRKSTSLRLEIYSWDRHAWYAFAFCCAIKRSCFASSPLSAPISVWLRQLLMEEA